MKSKNNKFLILAVILAPLAVLAIAGVCLGYNSNLQNNTVAVNNGSASIKDAINTIFEENINKPKEIVIPDSINLDVPFITQAPFFSWTTYPFNHTCEEASALMIHYYLSGIKTVDENITKQELLSLVDFENKNYGFSDDTTVSETARFIKDYYGYDVVVSYDISQENIKKELAKGNPVIIPAAGRLLFNPHFTSPGPLYHMLVIKGYNSKGFITDDPGTYKSGMDYEYSYDVLENAIHDFNPSNQSMDKPGAMIIVSPEVGIVK